MFIDDNQNIFDWLKWCFALTHKEKIVSLWNNNLIYFIDKGYIWTVTFPHSLHFFRKFEYFFEFSLIFFKRIENCITYDWNIWNHSYPKVGLGVRIWDWQLLLKNGKNSFRLDYFIMSQWNFNFLIYRLAMIESQNFEQM